MKITLTNSNPAKVAAKKNANSTFVTFAYPAKKENTADKKARAKSDRKKSTERNLCHLTNGSLETRLSSAILDQAITGKCKETVLFRELNQDGFRHVLVLGLGDKKGHELVRQACGALGKALASLKTEEIIFPIDELIEWAGESDSIVRAVVEGLSLATYQFTELKSQKADEKELLVQVVSENAKALSAAFLEAQTLAKYVNFARRLGDLPGNKMTPTFLADAASTAARGIKNLSVEIWDKKKIEKEKMGGLLSVAQGSEQEPRFIIFKYQGAGAKERPLVYVGKGLTFDCGGISIKPGAQMEEMKYDMCGGANILASVLAIAELGLKVNVYALVPSTENLVNGKATKPGDVFTARNGKTFEVNNTDAEGRLILSDALSYGSELEPQLMIDAATLTGAIIMALGNIHTGVFTRDDELAEKIRAASKASGERTWRMPLVDEHVDDMKGIFADLSNISSGKGAGSATAAAYLEQFVEPGIPWAHFDIAGTAWATGNRLSYTSPKGASGAMVRTFFELAKSYE